MKKLFFTFTAILLLVGSMSYAQTRVTGKVIDVANNLPIPFVTVALKGSNTVTTTVDDGSFTIMAPSNGILIVSYIGYTPVEVSIDGRNIVNVSLEEDSINLDQVVVTAMGISREKKTLGYASQEVKAEELEKAKQSDLNNALVGKVSGVIFYGGSGSKFDEGSILLRGTSTLSANGDSPIYVVDGVITSASSLNVDDVESLNVLKGPAATAVYGSRGGNGAVVITTKQAARDKAEVNFSQTFTIETPKLHGKYQNRYGGGNLGGDASLPGAQQLRTYNWNPNDPDYLRVLDGARYYDMNIDESWGAQLDGSPYAAFFTWDPNHPRFGEMSTWSPQPNNFRQLYQTGWNSSTNLAFSKSVNRFSVRFSFTDTERKGINPGSDATRKFLSFRTNFDVSKRIKVTLDYRLTYRKNHNAGQEGYSGNNASYTYSQWGNRQVNTKDLKDYKRNDGSFVTWNIKSIYDMGTSYQENPFALYYEQQRISESVFNNFNANLSYDITPKLVLSGIVMGNISNNSNSSFIPIGFRSVPEFTVNQSQTIDMQYQGRLRYANKWLDNRIVFEANAFVEQRSYSYDYARAFTRDGLSVPDYGSVSASLGLPGGSNTQRRQKDQSLFGISTISFDDTYFLEGSLRNDWNSTLPPQNNSYLYGGLSASVLVNKYLKSIKWLDFWKVRASVAQVGSTMPTYNVYETYQIGTKYGSLTSMYFDSNLKDPNIMPTISSSLEAGTEFRLFRNRLFADVNFYTKNSKNQIINMTVTGASGYTSVKINAGMIQNKGIEITLGGDIIATKKLNWNITANFSKNVNTLKSLMDGYNELQQGNWGTNSTLYIFAVVGQPVGELRGSSWRYEEATGLPILIKRPDNAANVTRGDYDVDFSSSGNVLGNVQPKATGGLTTSLTWKNINLGATMDYRIGGKLVSITNLYGEGSGLLETTAVDNNNGKPIRSPLVDGGGVEITGMVLNPATGVYEQVTTMIGARTYFKRKITGWDNYTYDASYVKLRELSLSYTFDRAFLKNLNIGITRARISFVATNPLLIYSGIPNIDPSEHSGDRAGDSNIRNAVEQGQLFSTRSYGFSINLTF